MVSYGWKTRLQHGQERTFTLPPGGDVTQFVLGALSTVNAVGWDWAQRPLPGWCLPLCMLVRVCTRTCVVPEGFREHWVYFPLAEAKHLWLEHDSQRKQRYCTPPLQQLLPNTDRAPLCSRFTKVAISACSSAKRLAASGLHCNLVVMKAKKKREQTEHKYINQTYICEYKTNN